MDLRPYQVEARDAILKEWDEGRTRTLLVLPTGAGKTIIFCAVTEQEVLHGRRVLVLAHRGELLDQARDKLKRTTGLVASVEKAELSCLEEPYRVTVGSIQSMSRPKRLDAFAPDYFDTIIVDEAHHCLSDTYQTVLSRFPGARVLGVTATPDRGDMRSLGQYFDSLAYEYTLPRAIRDGYLCRIKALTIPLHLDISRVEVKNGDYSAGGIASALDPYFEQIADEMVQYCKGRKTVVFLPLIATSRKMRDILQAHGLRAAEVNGESKDRDQVLVDFAAGRYDVLCNSMLLTEGWDCPDVDCIVMLRPTRIRSLYCQCVGRGTRLAPGKDYLLLLDFLWLTSRHDLVRPAALICKSDEVAQAMTKRSEDEAGEEIDIIDAEAQAEEDAALEREARLADELEKMRKRKRQLVDPLQYAMSILDRDLAEYESPVFGPEAAAPSSAQKSELEKRGIYPDEISTSGQAEQLLESLKQRQLAGLATPKQIRLLESRGFRDVGTWYFADAQALIARIAGHGWRVPPGVDPDTYQPRGMK